MSTSSPRTQNALRNARPVGRRKRPPARALRNPHRRLQRTTLLSFPTAYCIRLLASWLRWGELSLPLALRGEKSSPDHWYPAPRRQEIKEILKAKGAQSARSCPAAGCSGSDHGGGWAGPARTQCVPGTIRNRPNEAAGGLAALRIELPSGSISLRGPPGRERPHFAAKPTRQAGCLVAGRPSKRNGTR